MNFKQLLARAGDQTAQEQLVRMYNPLLSHTRLALRLL